MKKGSLYFLLILVVTLSGCTGGPNQGIGALLGSGIGLAAGGNAQSALAGGLIGAAVGGVADVASGDVVAGQQGYYVDSQSMNDEEVPLPEPEFGAVIVDYPPPIVVNFSYDGWGYYHEGDYVYLQFYRNGRVFHTERNWDQGRRMAFSHFHGWASNYHVRRSVLDRHRNNFMRRGLISHGSHFSGRGQRQSFEGRRGNEMRRPSMEMRNNGMSRPGIERHGNENQNNFRQNNPSGVRPAQMQQQRPQRNMVRQPTVQRPVIQPLQQQQAAPHRKKEEKRY